MTLIDSLDSILMLYSYSGFPERKFALFERPIELPPSLPPSPTIDLETELDPGDQEAGSQPKATPRSAADLEETNDNLGDAEMTMAFRHKSKNTEGKATDQRAKMNMMSGLSIILTLLSILVAFR